MSRPTIAVTGASGAVGAAVVAGLADTGEADVRALVRDPARAPAGADAVRVADYADRAALPQALSGADALVFVSSDGEAAPMLVHHINVLDAAVRAGVGRVVYLSILDVAADSPFCFAPVHRETERILRDTGLPHTVVRASVYGEFFARWIAAAARTGELGLPMGAGRVSLVSRSDVARVLTAAALRVPGGPHLVTGPEGYDLQGLAALAGRLAGTPVRAAGPEPAEFCARLLREGVSPWWAYAFTGMFESIGGQRFAAVTDTAERLTGRAPVPFADTARSMAAPG
ncbi:NAD(P)H dehydrogenase (quinone) [Murinocardiopsis flavida]|uniref:NAD(P)H dehydrogenase (Quinone) n=1 Tax=Murinocardiopsis flavida TaxID=645275 RepID=A0A2P8DTP6_9ACTN|nr:NAD(P)H-binding protein [Murinocardiopsis flavida]PSL00579.1 NAD(P)H dehydrogenase (quinone) [Murinocardiopsis flavida]